MVEPTLAAQLERLASVPHPLLQRLALSAIFQQLAKPEAARSRVHEAALRACLGHTDQACTRHQSRSVCHTAACLHG